MAEAFLGDFAHVPDAEVVAIGSRTRRSAPPSSPARHGVAAALTYADAGDRRPRRPLHRHAAPAAPRPGARRDPGRQAGAGGEVLHRDPGRRPRGRRRSRARPGCSAWRPCGPGSSPRSSRAREMVADGEIGDVTAVAGRLRCLPRLRPHQPTVRPRAGRGRRARPRGLRHLARPALPRHPRPVTATGTLYPNGTDASAVDAPVLRRRARRVPRVLADARTPAARRAGRHRRLHRDRPALPPPDPARRTAQRAPRWRRSTCPVDRSRLRPRDRRGRQCLAAGLTESPLMPLADTLDVQWVMEEALASSASSRRGSRRAEGVVGLTRGERLRAVDAAAQRLGPARSFLRLEAPLLRAAGGPGGAARRRWRGQGLAEQVGQPLAGGDPVAVLRAVLGARDRRPGRRASAAAPGVRCASVRTSRWRRRGPARPASRWC